MVSFYKKLTPQQEKNSKIVSFAFDQFCKAQLAFYEKERTEKEEELMATTVHLLEIIFSYFGDKFTDDYFDNDEFAKKYIKTALDNAPNWHIWE